MSRKEEASYYKAIVFPEPIIGHFEERNPADNINGKF
jgi:hypothetical protein